jgi:uncharacterized Zn finger protein
VFDRLSRAEEITSEVRRLVMTCRSLEAQLQQSVPKKTHQELVTKMQAAIDNLSADLARTKKELETTETLGGRLNALTTQISTQNEIIANQNKTIEAFSSKISETSVPMKVYNEVKSKVAQLEESINSTVSKAEYESLQNRYDELAEQSSTSVPRAKYAALEVQIADSVPKSQLQELESRLACMVPKEQYDIATSRVSELETSLSDSVQKSRFEEVQKNLDEALAQIETQKGRILELENSLSNSVPKTSYEDLQKSLEQTIPKSEFEVAAQKISELENTIANSVPRASFEELQKAFEQTVPRTDLESSRARVAELEDTLSNSVSRVSFIELHGSFEQMKVEFDLAKQRISELEATISDSVPKAKYEEIEAAMAQMVPKSEIDAATQKISELRASLDGSVPISKYEELSSQMQHMVSNEQHTVALAKISDLEHSLANSVPRSQFDVLTSKMSLLRELISGVSASTETPVSQQSAPAQEQTVQYSSVDSVTVGEVASTTPSIIDSPVAESPQMQTATVVETIEVAQSPAQTLQESPQPIVEPTADTPVVLEPQPAASEAPTTETFESLSKTTDAENVTAQGTEEVSATTPEQINSTEIREVQSQLSEIKGAQESQGEVGSENRSLMIVDMDRGFRFSSTEFCARSGLEFLEDIEKVDIPILELHSHNGDFERWFKDILSDETSSESLRAIRESNCSGEDLRIQMVSAIAPKYRN